VASMGLAITDRSVIYTLLTGQSTIFVDRAVGRS